MQEKILRLRRSGAAHPFSQVIELHTPAFLDQSSLSLLSPVAMKRLPWLDISKALAICWVVYFHFLKNTLVH
jgi:hypothetical protein